MFDADSIFLGFDPGGAAGFGVALLAGQTVVTETVSTVAEAVEWAASHSGASVPVAIGIDALLHWADGSSGWRPADRALRATYKSMERSVIAPNSLYGAMAIGGMALALRLRERWPEVMLNETHPKVLIPALGGESYADASPKLAMAWFADYTGLDVSGLRQNGHELDALLSAWATRQGIEKSWRDLVGDDSSLLFPAGRVRYFWPEPLRGAPIGRAPDRGRPGKTAAKGMGRTVPKTTQIGYVNRHKQKVIRQTGLLGNDHGQRVYVLECATCAHVYGANGSDIFQRRCPSHDGGAAGLPIA